jgi:DNA modification methylase
VGVEPYYQDEAVTIYHGDCREVLPSLQLSGDAVVVTDPPYNVGISYGEGTDDARGDYEAWCREWFGACQSAAHLVAVTPGIVNVAQWCRIAEPSWIVAWHKPAAMGRSPLGFCNWEPVLIYGKSKQRNGVDVIRARIIPDASMEGHPCPKPLQWGVQLINLLSLPSEVVVDPFSGSGTTLRAAKDTGRRAIGIEIEERYCEIAAKRLAQGALPLEMGA